MSSDKKNKRIRPSVLQEDLDAFAALEAMEGYESSNPAFTIEKIRSSKTSMQGNQTKEIQAFAAANALRDDTVASEWAFHDNMLGAKDQVKSRYGANSNEIASMGMKKKSEYKTGRRKTSADAAKS